MIDYPDHLVAAHVVHHPRQPGSHDPCGPVWTIGALSVRRVGEARVHFREHHYVYPADEHPHYPVRDLEKLLTPTTHLVCCNEFASDTPPPDYFDREVMVVDAITYAKNGTRHHLLQVPATHLDAIAAEHGIAMLSTSTSLLQQARLAPNRAQTVWLMFLWHYTRDPKLRAGLAKALLTWRAQGEARGVKF